MKIDKNVPIWSGKRGRKRNKEFEDTAKMMFVGDSVAFPMTDNEYKIHGKKRIAADSTQGRSFKRHCEKYHGYKMKGMRDRSIMEYRVWRIE
tara:strand:- start:254 stop:529 length:276 start_codon:yes stop_codon:yes gene_type:complete